MEYYIYIYMVDMITILEHAAREAGATALSYFHKESQISHKNNTHQNLVTCADTESQKKIQEIIISKLTQSGINPSDIGFIGEEQLETKNAKHMFVIDPLDGTGNFASGLDYFCTSIAHFESGVLMNSVVYWPTRNILYCAQKGKGAHKKNGGGANIPMQVTDASLKNTLVLMYLSAIPKYFERTAYAIEQISSSIRGIRLYGSTCLDVAHVADSENSAHLLVNSHLYLWDLAGALLILEEAGGVCYDFSGNKVVIDINSSKREFEAVAGHPHIVKAILPLLAR